MKRELWTIAKVFSNAIGILNSIFCESNTEKELTEEDKWMIVEQINSDCSSMMVEDAQDILNMMNSIPLGRLCERTDCNYHHPKNYKIDNFIVFQDKCDECIHNEKCKDKEMAMEHFEDFQG